MGVAHLAYTLANQIYQLQGKDLDISRSDVKCAEVAGSLPDSAQCTRIYDNIDNHATACEDLLGETVLFGQQTNASYLSHRGCTTLRRQ